MPSGESMKTLSNPPAANSQSTSSYPMPLTVRLIASTNGASIGNTLRTPKMKNGPSSPLFEEAGFEGALGSGRPRQSRLPRGPVWNVPTSDRGRDTPVAMLDSSNRPPRPKMHRHARSVAYRFGAFPKLPKNQATSQAKDYSLNTRSVKPRRLIFRGFSAGLALASAAASRPASGLAAAARPARRSARRGCPRPLAGSPAPAARPIAVCAARHAHRAGAEAVHGTRGEHARRAARAATSTRPARRARLAGAHGARDALEMGVLRCRLPVVVELRPEVVVVQVIEIDRRPGAVRSRGLAA